MGRLTIDLIIMISKTRFSLSVCGWGHSNNSVVHMGHQRNVKKELFFEAKHDTRELRLGVNMCLFLRKRVLLDSIKGRVGVIFQILPNMPSQKSLFRVDLGAKSHKVLDERVFFLGKSRLRYVFKTSDHACVQH